VTAGVIFALGAEAAEGALKLPRISVARVCPCISHMQCESVAITARDGIPLRAWYYTPEASNGASILVLHGLGGNRQDMVALGYLFLQQGYGVLVPDLRGHGESGGFITYGVLEENDVDAWMDWLANTQHVPRIYGFGVSMGASVLLDSLKHETQFRSVVAESAYSDFPSIAKERIGRRAPAGLRWIASPLVDSGMIWTRWKYGIDLRQASPADGLKATKVPVLLVHGLADERTSPENSRRLGAIDPAVQLWLVPDSGHADSWKTAKSEFESRVTAWFRTH
jgi:uncharacterized protein